MNAAFTVPSWKDPTPIAPLARPAGDGWRALAEALDAAKRQAALSFARLNAAPQHLDPAAHSRACDNWARDEVAVLRARVGLLNELMTHDAPAARPCIEHAASADPRVCVMYNRMRCEAGRELGPMQSTMSWVVRGAEKPMQHLMTAGQAHQPDALTELLDLIRAFMPVRSKTDALKPLHDVLALPAPDRLVQVRDQAPGVARAMEGLGAACAGTDALAPMYRLAWGALDVCAQEGWQNPSTNEAIRRSILDTAHQAIHQAVVDKGALWANAAFLQVHIAHGDEKHVLSVMPFCDSESCTVTHMQYTQSMFDQSGPERGILNLSADPGSIHAIPMGKILPIRSYVCPGAHRKGRLNEAQLNYVHAQGLLAHGFDVALLPKPDSLRFEQGGRIPAAKSTRISAAGLDVLASSYHLMDQVYTTISIVQYPPFGTQFAPKPALGPNASGPDWADQSEDEFDPSGDGPAMNQDDDGSAKPVTERPPVTKWNMAARYAMREDEEMPLYKLPREPRLEGLKRDKKWYTWEIELRQGEHYFVDGLRGKAFGEKGLDDRIILIEVQNGDRYKKAQKHMQTVRQLLRTECGQIWNKNMGFYENIENNQTIYNVWASSWAKYIANDQRELMRGFEKGTNKDYIISLVNTTGTPTTFWYTRRAAVWTRILELAGLLDRDNITETSEIVQRVYHFSKDAYQFWNANEYVATSPSTDNPSMHMTARQRPCTTATASLKSLKIPLPPPRTSSRRPAAKDAQLESRIQSLEQQLQDARQDGNTQHLLMQVLERLDQPS